jgi:hypothetical protein
MYVPPPPCLGMPPINHHSPSNYQADHCFHPFVGQKWPEWSLVKNCLINGAIAATITHVCLCCHSAMIYALQSDRLVMHNDNNSCSRSVFMQCIGLQNIRGLT